MLDPIIETYYISILKEELLLATGCTEPIAVAYAAAKLREVLGCVPQEVSVEVSGNILKNVKSVIVPNSGGLRGVESAVALGLAVGKPERQLQVIADVTNEERQAARDFLNSAQIRVSCSTSPCLLDIRLVGRCGDDTASIRIANNHTNLVQIKKNDELLLNKPIEDQPEEGLTDKSRMDLHEILRFADEVDLSLVEGLLARQLRCNCAIAEEGVRGSWGANVGSTLLQDRKDIKTEACAWAAAGSDARMSGCERPVVILSGSGNQGITASVPVWRYALHLGASLEELYRALIVSDLVTIYQKVGIGRLSAYCGAISAGVGAGTGIAYLHGADYDTIASTIVNAVAILSGTICDGAKPSCAAKISFGVEAGIMGFQMHVNGQNFRSGDGIVGVDVATTVRNIGILASEGMRQTDHTILNIMTD